MDESRGSTSPTPPAGADAAGPREPGGVAAGGAAVGARSRVAARYPRLARALAGGGGNAAAAGGDDRGTPTIHDAATAAVDHKGAGNAVDAGVASRVGAHLGADLGDVRVHQDPLSQEATAAMGARAFAYGGDVFLGAGESGSDVGLMAHELTHVVQQGAAGQRAPQRRVEVGAADSPAERQADAVSEQVTSGTGRPAQLLVDDGPVQSGQMLKSTFLPQLREQVTAAASEELGPVMSAIGCPYIDQYFGRYSGRPASECEALLRRYAPATRGARDAASLIPAVVARVREGVRQWSSTGEPPADIAAAEPAAAGADADASGDQAALLRAPDGGETLASLEHDLGSGQPLSAGTASRMAEAMGVDPGEVRLHTGPVASRKADHAGALAFTVGRNVVMSAAAPAAGTIEGDALLAHELAHVAQQSGAATTGVARMMPIGAESAEAEGDADQTAAAALAAASGDRTRQANRTIEARRTGLQLQRCKGRRNSGRVNQSISDGPYGWTSSYNVNLSGSNANILIKVKLVPDANVTPAQVTDIKTRARAAFRRVFDNKFILTDTSDSKRYNLRTDVQFVTTGQHYQVQLHVGPDGTSNRTNWYTGNHDETLAHELGHQLGLRDEYVDARVPNRRTGTSPGVHTDHSIMGNYLTEGRAAAHVHQRHGNTIGSAVGGATGRTFTVTRRP